MPSAGRSNPSGYRSATSSRFESGRKSAMDSNDVETYCEHGVWKSRRRDCDQPFSSGDSRHHQVTVGAEVARWAQGRHIIRGKGGEVVEVNVYAAPSHTGRTTRPPASNE
jgi:hypothetical protein